MNLNDDLTRKLAKAANSIMNTEATKLDKVNPKAVKKDFDDRKDKDIDNDGDVDSSDEYIHAKRKAISKAVKKEAVDLEEASFDKLAKKLGRINPETLSDVMDGKIKLNSAEKKEFDEFMKGVRKMFGESTELEEAVKWWKVTITKKTGKLFKGQTVDVKASNSAQAIKKGLEQMKADPTTVPSGSVDAVLGESTELEEDKDDYIVVIQGAGDNKQKILQVFKGTQLDKAKKYRDDWNKKNANKIKKNKKGQPMAAHGARLYTHPAEATINGKSYIPKVGDRVSWSMFGQRVIKESTDFEKTNTLTSDEYDEVQNFQNFNKKDWRWLPKQGKYVRKKKV